MEPQRSSRWALVLVVLNFFAEPSGSGPVPDSCVAAELAQGAWGALPPDPQVRRIPAPAIQYAGTPAAPGQCTLDYEDP